MKTLPALLIACALGLTACAQFTTDAPEHRHRDFRWTSEPPEHRDPDFHWSFDPARPRQDAATRNFIHRASLTNDRHIVAVARLVFDLKRSGVWTNLAAFYPLVGGNARACAQNLVSTNHTIAWHGTNTFNASGVTGDGQSGYGDTGYNPSVIGADNNSFHLFVYYGTNGMAGGPMMGIRGPGVMQPGAAILGYDSGWQSIDFRGVFYGASAGNERALGRNFILQRVSAEANEAINDVFHQTDFGLPGAIEPPPNTNLLVLSVPHGGGFGRVNLRAVSFGRALSHDQITNYFNAVTRFETALGRAEP